MNKKISKLLFELSRNSRITTKELSSRLRVSQQACSYLVNRFRKKKWIRETAVVDAVKLGYTKVIVGFDFLNFEKSAKKGVIDYFSQNSSVTSVEETKQGIDLLVEYSTANLSAFNKTYSEAAEMFRKTLKTRFILPVIVKHKFRKNYLSPSKDPKDIILCGDRNIVSLDEKETAVLREIAKNPSSTLVSIGKKTSMPAKMAALIKKRLEKMAIINGYSCVLDNSHFKIRRKNVFFRLANHSAKEMARLVEYSRHNRNIVDIIKVIGNYHALLVIEETQKERIVREIREMFEVEEYLSAESAEIHKKTYLPLE